jgi:hypothetical protein
MGRRHFTEEQIIGMLHAAFFFASEYFRLLALLDS